MGTHLRQTSTNLSVPLLYVGVNLILYNYVTKTLNLNFLSEDFSISFGIFSHSMKIYVRPLMENSLTHVIN